MRPRRAAAPAKPPATVPVRASFGAGVCFVGVAGVAGVEGVGTGVAGVEGVGVGVAGVEGVGTGVAGVEGTGVAVTEGVGVGVAGVEGVGVGVEADGVGAGLFDTLRIAMSVFAPTARAFAGSFGSTVRAAASKPRIVWPGTISYPSGNAAAFLLSDLASGITGEITYVDAGYSNALGGVEG